MGNAPSHQNSPSRGGHGHGPNGAGGTHNGTGGSGSGSGPTSPTSEKRDRSSSRQPNLRLPMPARPTTISPGHSNPTSPSGGRSGSPRRRKSLELPDLNKLAFTPAAPVVTIAHHTSHGLEAPAGHAKRHSDVAGSSIPAGSRRWQQALGGRAPLGGMGLSPMSKLESGQGPMSAPVHMPNASVSPTRASASTENPYFPSAPTPKPEEVPLAKALPIPIPGKAAPVAEQQRQTMQINTPPRAGTSPPPSTVAPTPAEPRPAEGDDEQANDGLVAVPIQWTQGGKEVYVTGTFADNWKGRVELRKSTHDFNTVLRLPPGEHKIKFVVDGSWRCSKSIPTATDDDGTLVNYIEVEAAKTQEELKQEWAVAVKPVSREEEINDSKWTNVIPPALSLYQYLEELPHLFASREQYQSFLQGAPYLAPVPQPPMLPRIMDKVIVNADYRKVDNSAHSAQQMPAGRDDNSILAVPNHVVLNHLTASAIKNGTLGVGTTTRYRQKYITTMYFRQTGDDVVTPGPAPNPVAA